MELARTFGIDPQRWDSVRALHFYLTAMTSFTHRSQGGTIPRWTTRLLYWSCRTRAYPETLLKYTVAER